MVVNPGNSIFIIGSGTAGLLSALFFKKNFLSSNVTIVRSKEIGVVGVGESTTPIIVDFLKYLEIDLYDFFKNSNATIKLGIKFINWNKESFYHGFLPRTLDFEDLEIIKNGINKKDFYTHINPFNKLMEENKIGIENDSVMKNYALHFDNQKTIEYLESICLLKNIKIIDDKIEEVRLNQQENVCGLIGSKDVYKCSFVVDCSGQNRLISKIYNKKFYEYEDLLIDTGMPCVSKEIFTENYTSATALDSGWMWKIPTKERTGIGYVYSSKFISEENAFKELKNIAKVDTYRTIKFTPGRFYEICFKNVLLVGLSSHFLEPLEATNLKTVALSLKLFLSENSAEQFNKKMLNIIEEIKTFILFHYLTNKKTNLFWNAMHKNAINNDKVKSIITNINERCYNNFLDYEGKFSTASHILFMQKYNLLSNKSFNSLDKSYFLKKNILANSRDYRNILEQVYSKTISL